MIGGIIPPSVRSSCKKEIANMPVFLAANIGVGHPVAVSHQNHATRKPTLISARLGSAPSLETRKLAARPRRVGNPCRNLGNGFLLPVTARTRLKLIASSDHRDTNR